MRSEPIGTATRVHLILLTMLLGLAGCGAVPEGPVLPDIRKYAVGPGAARSPAEGLTLMAESALQAGDADGAAGLYEQAVLRDGKHLPAALGYGHALLMLGRYREAGDTKSA